MRVLLDNNVNHRFGSLLIGHEVIHARALGWAELFNGDLISEAEAAGFQVMITADKQMQYQQNLRTRNISIIVLNSLMIVLADISHLAPQVQEILDAGPERGSFTVVSPKT
jgi:predicted nuclease of predicted toxin-antitoxin system